MSPSTIESHCPVIVTVWGMYQLLGVKVRLDRSIVPSVVSLDDRPMVTLAVGGVFRTTVKVAVPPASVVVRVVEGLTLMIALTTLSVRSDCVGARLKNLLAPIACPLTAPK